MSQVSSEETAATEYAKELLKANKRREAISVLRKIKTPTAQLLLAKLGVRPPLAWWHYVIGLILIGVGVGAGYGIGATIMRQDMYRYFLLMSCRGYQRDVGSVAEQGRPNTNLCRKWVDSSFPEKWHEIAPYISSGCLRAVCFNWGMGMPPWPLDVPIPEGAPTLTPEGYVKPTITPIDISVLMTEQAIENQD